LREEAFPSFQRLRQQTAHQPEAEDQTQALRPFSFSSVQQAQREALAAESASAEPAAW
jgi:hypothetical protein